MTKYLYWGKILTYEEAMKACAEKHPKLSSEELRKYFDAYTIEINEEEEKDEVSTYYD